MTPLPSSRTKARIAFSSRSETLARSSASVRWSLARELTKIHEEFLRGTADSIRKDLAARGTPKGEITLVIGRGNEKPDITDIKAEVERLVRELSLDRMEAIKLVAKQLGLPKQEVYRRVAVPGSNSQDKNRD